MDSGHPEEIDGDRLLSVILQKCAALLKCVGTLVAIISQLDTQPNPAYMCPCQRFAPNLATGHA